MKASSNIKSVNAVLDNRELSNISEFLVSCISDFANLFKLKNFEAYAYLNRYLGIDFLLRHYDALHTQSIEDAVNDLITVCNRNGGGLVL